VKSLVTPLERVVAALTYKDPDRVPAAPLVCGASRRVYGVTYDVWSRDPVIAAKSLIAAQELIGFDGFLTLIDLSVEPAAFGQKVIYPVESTALSAAFKGDMLIKSIDDYDKLQYVDPKKADRMRDVIKLCEILVQEKGKEIPTLGFVYGPAGTLSMMRTLEKLSIDLVKNKSAVQKALKVINDVLFDYAKAQYETGVPGVVLDVLFASKMIWSRKTYDEFEGQYCSKIADEIRKHALVVLHNCGHGPYFDTMISWYKPAAISYHYVPDGCKDYADTKQKYGKQTVLIGHADNPRVVYPGTPEEVINHCTEQIKAYGPGSGYILATGCEFPPNASLLNARAMVEASDKYGRYPMA
jgi:uroporphyrinogen decarboxylase